MESTTSIHGQSPRVTLKALLEAGVHFGHQAKRWNPKMKPYIFAERNGIHIIDLAQTVSRLEAALEFVRETVRRGDSVLFVGTKKQAQEALAEAATTSGQHFVNTRWLGWEGVAGLEQLVLLYDEPDPPVLLALAEPPAESMSELLATVKGDLPQSVYAHLTPALLDPLTPVLVPGAPPVEHRKLGLADPSRLRGDDDGVVALGTEDLDEVVAFYERAYPGTWFEPRMLETRRYVGIRDESGLVCVAGVHVWSPAWRVAALGNVATLPEARGRGLATAACASLCRLLLDDGIDVIALNVRADNLAAIRAYEKLGFAHAADYVEVPLIRA